MCFFLSIFNSYAQLDEEYIETINNKVSVGLNLGGLHNNFSIRSVATDYELNSNIIPTVGLWFKYKKLPAISIGIPLTSINADSLANSKGFTFNLNSQVAKGFFIDGYLNLISGFNFKKEINSSHILALPNTVNLNINLELYYVFNFKKYSYKSAYLFGEIQKKSSGSFTAGLATGFLYLGNKIPFFNSELNTNNNVNFKTVNGYTIAILGGYMHTIVFGKKDKWYINGSLFAGPNVHLGNSTYFTDNDKEDFVNLGFNAKYKGALGYNINKLSFRISSEGNFIGYKPSAKSFITNNLINLRLESIYKF